MAISILQHTITTSYSFIHKKIPRTSAFAEIQGIGENDYLTTLSMPLVLDMCCGCCEAVGIGIYIDAVTRL